MDSENKNYNEIELLLKSIDKKNQILSKYLKYFNQKQLDFINLTKAFRSKFEEDHFSDGGRSFISYLGEFKEANRILNDFINELKEKNLYISEETQLEIKHTPKGSTSLNYLIDKLSTYLVENIEGKKIACMGGSFKPPHSGHFQVVKEALEKLLNVDQFIIFVGNAVRDGITQEQSIQIWGIYQKYLSDKVKVVPTDKPPIRSIYDYAKENQGIEINWVLGIRKGQEEDKADYKRRTSAVEKYPNLKTLVINTEDPNISGTNARAALENKDEFLQFVPNELSNEDKDKVWNILSEKQVDEIKVNNPSISSEELFNYITKNNIGKNRDKYLEILNRYGYFKSDNNGYVLLFFDQLSTSDRMKLYNDFKNYVNSKNIQENKSLSNGDFKKYINYLDKIVKHCCDELQIPRPKINIINNDKYPLEHQSFGGYKPGKNEIDLVIKNRSCSDSMRTLAHELKHADQDHRGVLTPDSGKDGSEHENEANSFSGKIMREFNRKYPEILVLTLKSVNKSYTI